MTDTLFGMRVFPSIAVQPLPYVQIHPDFPYCTPEFRARINRRYVELFGTYMPAFMFDPSALGIAGGRVMVVNPQSMALLRAWSEPGCSNR